jgi:hypothetical protein
VAFSHGLLEVRAKDEENKAEQNSVKESNIKKCIAQKKYVSYKQLAHLHA